MGSQSDICLTVSVFGVRLVFPLWICLWTLHLSVSYCLIWAKKKWKKERNKKENNNKPLADFKSVQQVLLVFLDSQEKGDWASIFSLPMVLRASGPGLGCNIHSLPASGPGPPWATRLQSATQSLGRQRVSISRTLFHLATQSLAPGSNQLLSFWACCTNQSQAHRST